MPIVRCPSCEKKVQFAEVSETTVKRCPLCGNKVTIPRKVVFEPTGEQPDEWLPKSGPPVDESGKAGWLPMIVEPTPPVTPIRAPRPIEYVIQHEYKPSSGGQMASGFFHAFGGCFGIIAVVLVVGFACVAGCTYFTAKTMQELADRAVEQQAKEAAESKRREEQIQKEEAINKRIIQGRERQERDKFIFPALPQKTKQTPKRPAIPEIIFE